MGRMLALVVTLVLVPLGAPARAAAVPKLQVSLAFAGGHGTFGEMEFHRLGATDTVPLRLSQPAGVSLLPGNYTVTASVAHAACPEQRLTLGAAMPTGYRVTCVPIPACTPHEYDGRCTPLGLLGPWTSARVADGGSSLVVSFDGFCGTNPADPYRAHVIESTSQVSVAIYGARPFSNLCANGRTLVVYLAAPLGSRAVVDASTGQRHL